MISILGKKINFLQDPEFPVYVAVAVVGITVLIILFAFLFRRGKKGRSILICGPCEAGKTQLFGQLLYKKPVCNPVGQGTDY